MGLTSQKFILLLMCACTFISACSSTRWVVENEGTIDKNDYKILDSELFLARIDQIKPDEPLVKFRLKTANTVEYAERIRTSRYIQTYKPKVGYVIFGLTSAAIAGYAAFSNDLVNQPNNGQKIALVGAGIGLTGISFLNMKPVGEPTPTGESRLLRRTGKAVQTDTLNASSDNTTSPEYEILLQDKVVVKRTERPFVDNLLSINLGDEIDPSILPDNRDLEIGVNVFFNDSTYTYSIPVTSVFEPFVIVTSELTALRNRPVLNVNNVLTDLAKGSQLRLVKKEGDWVKVLYGITETWIASSDVNTLWRSSEFARQLSVIAIPNVPFGNIDVEKNIPNLVSNSEDRYGFILSNGGYTDDYSERLYAKRDARLMNEYFNRTLGVPEKNTLVFVDQSTAQDVRGAFNDLSKAINQLPAELIVYLSGYARIDNSTGEIYFIGTSDDSTQTREASLTALFENIAQLPLTKVSVIADIDFVNKYNDQDALEKLASRITSQIENSGVVFASELGQSSLIYSAVGGENKRHSIFTYYIAEAFKSRYTNWGAIVKHLERNVSYTSRSLFNKAQDIRYFGKLSLDLSY